MRSKSIWGSTVFSPFSDPEIVKSIAAGLAVAAILTIGAWTARRMRRRAARKHRALTLVEANNEGAALGCEVVHPDSQTRAIHKSDRRGYVPIPLNWPSKCRVRIERAGRVLVNEVELDFSKRAEQELTLP